MKKKHALSGLLAGLAVGGALGVLFAPKSGKQTRKDLEKHAKKISKDVSNKVSEVKDLTQEKYETMVGAAVDNYEKVQELSKEQVDYLKKSLTSKWGEAVQSEKKSTKAKK